MRTNSFNMHLRRALTAALTVLPISMVANVSAQAADAWPARSLTLVVPQAAGGGTDAVSRMWADFASKKLGQTVVVDNKPGAGGAIAAGYVVRQPADGYTVYVSSVSQMVLNRFTYKSLPYNPDQDFRGVAMLTITPFLLVASKESGIRNLDDLKRIAKAEPGKLNFSSAGKGNSTHLVMELLNQQIDVKLTHVPYQGESKGITGLMSGEIQLMTPTLSTGVTQAAAGRVVPLVVLGANRAPQLPEVPTAQEVGLKGFEAIGWLGLAVRAGTPDDVVVRLHEISQQFLADPAVAARMRTMQVDAMPGPANALQTYTAKDTQRWGAVVKDLGLAND